METQRQVPIVLCLLPPLPHPCHRIRQPHQGQGTILLRTFRAQYLRLPFLETADNQPRKQKQEKYNNKKNRVPHGIRFSKTNYLKTNLLKQIKKIFATFSVILYTMAKLIIFSIAAKKNGKKITKKLHFYVFS